jgi:hypothetical protein
MATPSRELPLRITVNNPPANETFAMQTKDAGLVPPVRSDGQTIVFDVTVNVAPGKEGEPNVLGPLAHGSPAERFLYLNSGTLAGDEASCWTRRAKIRTAGITWELVEQTLGAPGRVLEATVNGRARDGGPCCAGIPLLSAWRVAAT